jgi:hypothetical protein
MAALAIAILIAIWLGIGALCAWQLRHASELDMPARRRFA